MFNTEIKFIFDRTLVKEDAIVSNVFYFINHIIVIILLDHVVSIKHCWQGKVSTNWKKGIGKVSQVGLKIELECCMIKNLHLWMKSCMY